MVNNGIIMIMIYLLDALEHEWLTDFPETLGNGITIPTDFHSYFSEG
jgi:hypothetical protein